MPSRTPMQLHLTSSVYQQFHNLVFHTKIAYGNRKITDQRKHLLPQSDKLESAIALSF